MTAHFSLAASWPSATILTGAAARLRPASAVKPLPATGRFAPTVRRLVVLVPDAETDEAAFAAHLWKMASARELAILLLGHCSDAGHEPRARRRLAALAALIRDDRVAVETRLEVDRGWINAIRPVLQNTDLVVCHAEQHVAHWGLRRRPLSQLLAARLDGPVCVVEGFYPELPPEPPGQLGQVLRLAVPILVVVAFTALEILIHRTTKAAAYTFLMSLSVLVEYGLIGIWYSLHN